MKLTSEEVEEIKPGKPIKLWRFDEPRSCDENKKYEAGGEIYTVLDIRVLSQGDAMRLGKSIWAVLRDLWPVDRSSVWCITVVKGDRTDHPRLLAANPGAQKTDYVDQPSKAAREEPEAVPENVTDRFADAASPGIERKQATRAKKQTVRRATRRLKKALDSLDE